MEFEQCEIRANKYGSLSVMHAFVAGAMGPHGSYIVARTPRFPPYKSGLLNTLFMPQHGYYEPDDKPFQRDYFDDLVNHLIRVKWEPLTESGVNWYSRKFRRPVLLHVPDPAPSAPYIIGDEVEWHQKALKATSKYERYPNERNCRKLAESFMQYGLALERIRQFEEAFETYGYAAVRFDEIQATEEAAKAHRWAQRIMEFYRKNS